MKSTTYLAKSISIFTFSIISLAACAQDFTWFDDGHEWYYRVDCMNDPACGYVQYQVLGDTLLADEVGRVLQKTSLEEGQTTVILPVILRQANDTVFRYSPEAGRWHMLYDMAAEPGDVWNIQSDEEYLGYGLIESDELLFRVVVDSVATVMISGESRRAVYTSAWTDGNIGSDFHFGYGGIILEGIGPAGSARGQYGQSTTELIISHPAMFQCFISNGELLLGSAESPCITMSTSSHEAQTRHFLLFPNPARGQFGISATEGQALLQSAALIDMQGCTVRAWGTADIAQGTQQTFDVGGLPSGIYLLQLSSDRGMDTHKLILE